MDEKGKGWLALIVMGLIVLLFAGFIERADADWDGPTDPQTEAWFRAQRNAKGEVCCDGTEVVRVDDYQWRGGMFEIIADGVTYHAGPDKVSRDSNKLGPALVWFYPKSMARSDETLRCFMRGMES